MRAWFLDSELSTCFLLKPLSPNISVLVSKLSVLLQCSKI